MKHCEKTGKVRFRDEVAAMYALATHAEGKHRDKDEVRAYRCPFCHGWHLTSQPIRKVS